MLKSRIRIFLFFSICFVLATCLISCKGKVSVSTADLKDAVTCKSVDPETKKPLEVASIFQPETPEIFCSVALINATKDAEVKAEWYYLQRDAEEITERMITDYALKAKGSVYLVFSLTKPTNGFPVGDYKCKLYLDGKEKVEVPFQVESQSFSYQWDEPSDQEKSIERQPPPQRTGAAFLSEATMCMSVDPQSSKPDEIADFFPPYVPEIFCSVKISNAPRNTAVLSEWIYVKGDVEGLENYKISEYTLQATGSTYLSFSLERGERDFPRGNYILKLSVDGKEELRVPFKVQ